MRFYVSHSIRGKYGKDATPVQMKENCDAIKVIAAQLREVITPDVEFYLPAEHEDFVTRAYHLGYINEKEILDVDCRIIGEICDAVIIYVPEGDELQGGRKIEYDYVITHGIPVFVFDKVEQAIGWVAQFILRN